MGFGCGILFRMNEVKDITHARLELAVAPEQRRDAADFLAHFDVSQAPGSPGCYIMQDAKGRPIYVGKAKNLRARLRNYVNASDSRYSVKFLMRRVARIDFLVTATEKEALLLENSLIKQYHPRYNVRLRDDKTFISLRFDPREEFPRLTVVRRFKKDGARYFGPYHDAASVRQTLREIQRLFPLRTCSDHVLHNRSRPCLYYQMKQCLAPCAGYVNREAYHEIAEQAVMVLDGRSAELEKTLLEKIGRHAEALEYEAAAVLRDRLYALRRTMEKQRTVILAGAEDRDVFGLYSEGRFTEIQILFYRGGKMLGGRGYSFEYREMPDDELLSSFLLQFYAQAQIIPSEILLPLALEDADTLAGILSEERGGRVSVLCPQRGEKRALIDLAQRNAKNGFAEKRLADKAVRDTLEQIRRILNLPRSPERIECFDVSTIQGESTVAAMVVFENGLPAKGRYRRFSMRGVTGQDDFASLREALMRRYTRAIAENDLPDLLLIDGGKGQLNVAGAVLKDLGIEDLPHAGIAKARAGESGAGAAERFFLPGRMNPVIPPQSGPVVHLLARIRDEAHRFAIGFHRQRRTKAGLASVLTEIPGIGPAKARTLLNRLGSVAKIRETPVEAIAALPGFNPGLAEAVLRHLNEASRRPASSEGPKPPVEGDSE